MRRWAWIAACLLTTSTVSGQPTNTLPIVFRVAEDIAPVVGPRWIDEQLRWANRVFAPTGMRFQVLEVVAMPEKYRDVDTIYARNRLERFVRGGVVNCFVVGRLRDIHDPTQMRRGVHWQVSGVSPKHYVILSKTGPPTTLAHELGHYFGIPEHSSVAGNIMSYVHGDHPAFDSEQTERVRRAAFEDLRMGRLFTLQGLQRVRELRDRAAVREARRRRQQPG